jgi:hypothetical protein
VEKIEQLWEDFEVSARYDGLAYIQNNFRKNKIPEDIILMFTKRYQQKNMPGYAPEPLSNVQQSAPKNGTSPVTSTGDKDMDKVIQELTEEPKPKRKQAYGKRQVEKDIAKDLILHFLNAKHRRRKGYKILTIYEEVEWVNAINERTMRRYMDELYKDGKIKMWKKPLILSTGQNVYHKWYPSATNPDPNFTLWLSK